MKELSKDEILDWFERFKRILTLGGIWNRRSEQIYRQVHQLIENQPEVDERKLKAKIHTAIESCGWSYDEDGRLALIGRKDFSLAVNKVLEQIRLLLQEAGVRIKENEKS